MKKRSLVLGFTLVALLLSSCSTMSSTFNTSPGYIPIIKKDVRIVGTVKVEYATHGILGLMPEFSLISWGDRSSYVALLEEAKKIGADDVVNIKTDLLRSNIFVFYNQRTWIASGIAVKYLDGVPKQPDLGN
jgi:hypothetical protein